MLTLVRARRWLALGFLPSTGGWLDQNARLVSALEVIVAEESFAASEMAHSGAALISKNMENPDGRPARA